MDKRTALNESLQDVELKHLKYEGNFKFSHSNTVGINGFGQRELETECSKIVKLIEKHCSYQTVSVIGNYTQESSFNSYISDVVISFELGFKKLKGLIKKFIEQRLANISKTRRVDNFRYVCEIGTNTANAMLTPYGYITDIDEYKGKFYQIDRSTLEEFLSRNLLPHLPLEKTPFNNQKEFDLFKEKAKLDKITKTELITLYDEFKDLLDDSEAISDFWTNLIDMLENESASAEFTLWDLIQGDKFVVDTLLAGIRQHVIIIGRYSVVSRELEKINNKGNLWVDINFEFKKLWNKTKFSMVGLIQSVEKNAEKYKKLLGPSTTRKKSFNKKLNKAPEYMLLPHLAKHMWGVKGFSYAKVVSDSSKVNWHEFVEFLEGKQIHQITKHYGDQGINADVIESELDIDLIDTLFKVKTDKWESKLKFLRQCIDLESNPEYWGAKEKIDRIINEDHGINPLLIHAVLQVSKLPNGVKILKEPDNVQKIVDMYMKSHFGNHIFTIDKVNKGYLIKCSLFQTYLEKFIKGSAASGHQNSHEGRANLFLNEDRHNNFKKYYDDEFDGDSNKKFTKKKLTELGSVIDRKSCVWYEHDHSGKPVACGYTEEGKVMGTSAEHLDNTTNVGRVLRAVAPNSAEGRIHKTITNPSDWYDHMANIQPKFEKQHGDTIKMNRVITDLKAYANYLRDYTK